MLNAGYKKEALKKCEEAANVYKKEYDSTVAGSNLIYHKKEEAIDILKISVYFLITPCILILL